MRAESRCVACSDRGVLYLLVCFQLSSVGDVLSSRTAELSDGLGKLEDQTAGVSERVQQTEAVIFKAQKREADRMAELSRELAVVLEVVRTTREDQQRFEVGRWEGDLAS